MESTRHVTSDDDGKSAEQRLTEGVTAAIDTHTRESALARQRRARPAPKFELGGDLARRINELTTDLDAYAETLRTRFDRQSRAWKESPEGTSTDGWIEDVSNVAQVLEDLAERPEL
jgi:hypothetical protein